MMPCLSRRPFLNPFRTALTVLKLALTLALFSGYSSRADLTGLFAYWPFEEGSGAVVADDAGSNDGTLNGTPEWVASPIGSFGLELNGPGDYVQIGDPAAGDFDFNELQSFSFGAWINPSVIDGTGRRIISKRGDSENIGFELGLWSGADGLFAEVSDGATELSTADFFDIHVPEDQWSFVMAVVSREEGTLRVYVNGVEAESVLDIFGLGTLASEAPLELGRASGNSARGFLGVIDDVRIYNRALSGLDVQELFASMQSPLEFVEEPADQTVDEGQPVTFTVTVSGSPPYMIQWYENSAPIDGATGLSYTIETTSAAMSGNTYSVSVDNFAPSSIFSREALLTVRQELIPPEVVEVFSRVEDQVVIVFSEPVSPETAELISNYTIEDSAGQPVPLSFALLEPNEGLSVTLTTGEPLVEDADYTLLVSGVQDRATTPNTIAPGASAPFQYSSLVGHWAFDESDGDLALDSSLYSNDGVLSGGPARVNGILGGALLFDGSDDYVDAGDPASGVLDFGALDSFSFGAWINPSEAPDSLGRRIFSKRNSADVGYEFSIINTPHYRLFTELGDGSSAPSSYDEGIDLPVTVGEWHHVMNVVDRSTGELRIYLHGRLAGTLDVSALGSVELNAPLNFGRASGNSARSFFGMIDDVRIYSRALSLQEIENLANRPDPEDIVLEVTTSQGQIMLDWAGSAELEWAPTVLGPWNPVTPAPNPPYGEDLDAAERRFFRLKALP